MGSFIKEIKEKGKLLKDSLPFFSLLWWVEIDKIEAGLTN